ncbi:MAG: CHASE2 domain-containing protein [Verrucomicrobiia bacterium]
MKERLLKLAPILIPLAVISVVCLVAIFERVSPGMGMLDRWEHDTYDWRSRKALTDDAPAATNLATVFIDNYSLDQINEAFGEKWPWPTVIHANIVRELSNQDAEAVAFDVLFAEEDMNPDYEELPSDVFFGLQLSNANNVVLATFGDTKTSGAWEAELPNDRLRTNAFNVGHATADFDKDGILRRAAVFKTDKEHGRIWHMAVVMAAKALDIDLDKSTVTTDRVIFRDAAGATVREMPIDQNGFFYINWRLAWNDPRLAQFSALQLFNMDSVREDDLTAYRKYLSDLRAEGSEIPTDTPYANKLVFIGSTASGNNVSDVGATPVAEETFLVSKHWNIANSILMGEFIKRSSLGLDLLLIILLGAISGVLSRTLKAPWPSISVIVVGLVYFLIAVKVFLETRYWMPIILPEFGGLLLTHVALVSYQVIFEQKEKRRVKDVFSKLVSPNVVHELLAADQLNFGGKRKNITVMFSDVRGFTSMTDEYHKRAEAYKVEHADDPEKVEAFSDLMAQESLSNVNIYLGAISNMVKKHNGTLDKYMGDCVMAFWGAPTENEQHALSCVRASVDGQRAMHRLNLERMAENQKRKKLNVERIKNGEEPLDMLKLLSLGSGINSGVCIVGLMGSDQHILNFTVFGREVNLASRLEAVSGRGRIIIGENTYNEIKSYAPEFLEDCKPLQPVTVKGIENPVPIYEVPWMENWEEREALELEIIGEVIPLKPAAALVYDAKPKAQSLDDA